MRMENERLVDLISSNELARETNCLLVKIKKNEEGIKKAESELLLLEEDNLVELPKRNCDPQFVLDGIDKLRKDNFRKAKIGKKKAVIGEVIKAIHIHPDNILKIVFWASDFQSREERKEARKQKGVVLPFLKLGRPLAASFTMGAAGGRELSAAKKAAEIGTYAPYNNRIAPVVGASAFGLGGGGGTCTHVQGSVGKAYYVCSRSYSPSDRPFGLGESDKPRFFLQVSSGRSCQFFLQENWKTCLPDSVSWYWHLKLR